MRVVLTDGEVDLAAGTVRRAGGVHHLTPRECALLDYLVQRAPAVMEREQILADVWGYGPKIQTRTLDTTLRRLRRKIEPDPTAPVHVVTVFGEGVGFRGVAGSTAAELARSLDIRVQSPVEGGRTAEIEAALPRLMRQQSAPARIAAAWAMRNRAAEASDLLRDIDDPAWRAEALILRAYFNHAPAPALVSALAREMEGAPPLLQARLALAQSWQVYRAEGVDAALQVLDRLDLDILEPADLALFYNRRGAARALAAHPGAAADCRHALRLARRMGTPERSASVLTNLALIDAKAGNAPAARDLNLEAIALWDRLGRPERAYVPWVNLINVLISLREVDRAHALAEQSLDRFASTLPPARVPLLWLTLANAALAAGARARARHAAEEGLALAEESGNGGQRAWAKATLCRLGVPGWKRLGREALAAFEASGDLAWTAQAAVSLVEAGDQDPSLPALAREAAHASGDALIAKSIDERLAKACGGGDVPDPAAG